MAETIADLQVRIKADTAELESKLNSAQTSVTKFSTRVGEGMKSAGMAMTAGLTVPLMAIGALALKSNADVGGAFTEIKRKTGETGAALEGLKTVFKNVFSSVPVDAKEAASAIAQISIVTGLAGKDLEKLTTQFINLAKITGSELIPTVDSATKAMNAFMVPAKNQTAQLDVLYEVATRTGIPMQQLLDELQQYAPVFDTMNIGIGRAALYLGQLNKAGVDAAPVIRGLNSIIKLTVPNNLDSGAAFEELTKKIQASKNPVAEFGDLFVSKTGMNVKSAEAFIVAIKNNAFSLDTYNQILKDSPGAIERMAIDTRSMGDTLTGFKQQIELAMQPLGKVISRTVQDMKPQMDLISDLVGKATDKFSQLPPPVQKAVVVMGMFAAQLGPSLAVLGNMMPLFEKAGGMFTGAGTAAGGFAGKIVGIPVTLASIGASVPSKLGTVFKEAQVGATGLLGTLKSLTGPAATIAATGISVPKTAGLGTMITDLKTSESSVARIAGKFLGIGPAAAGVAGSVRGWGSELKNAEGSIGKLSVGFGGVRTAASSIGGAVKSGASGILGMVTSVGGMVPLWGVIAAGVAGTAVALGTAYATSGRFRSLMGELGGIAVQFGTHLSTAFSKLTSGDVGGAVNDLKIGLTEAWQSITKIDWRSALSTIRTEMVAGIKSAWDQAATMVKSIDWGGGANNLKNMLSDAWNQTVDLIKNVDWGGVWNSLVSTAGQAWDSVVAWAKSVDWHGVGVQAGTMIGNAIVEAVKGLIAIGDWLLESIAGVFSGGAVAATATSGGQTVGGGLKEGIMSALGGVGEALAEQLSRIEVNWGGMLEGLTGVLSAAGTLIGGYITNGIADAINNMHLPGIHVDKVDTSGMEKNLGQAILNYKPSEFIHIKTQMDVDLAKLPEMRNTVYQAVSGKPYVATVTTKVDENSTSVVKLAVAGPHQANVYVTNPDGTVKAPVAMAATGPFPANAFVVNPDGTVRAPIASAASNNGQGHSTTANLTNADTVKGATAKAINNDGAGHPAQGNFGWGASKPPESIFMQVFGSFIKSGWWPFGSGAINYSGSYSPTYTNPSTASATATSATTYKKDAKGAITQAEAEAFSRPITSGIPHVTTKAHFALIGEEGPEAVIPQKYWGGIAPWVLRSLPRLAGGGTTAGDASSDRTTAKKVVYNINVTGIKMEDVADEIMKKIKMREMVGFSKLY